MTDSTPTYRPHNKGHDYYAPGIYLITLVTPPHHPPSRRCPPTCIT